MLNEIFVLGILSLWRYYKNKLNQRKNLLIFVHIMTSDKNPVLNLSNNAIQYVFCVH